MRWFLPLIGLIFLLILLPLTVFFFYRTEVITFRSRATFQQISKDNSLAVSVPSCVAADGEQISRLHVYCLNGRGLGEPNMHVSVYPTSVAQNLEIQAIQGTTDDTGKAIFDITSGTEGFFDLTITCGETIVKTDHKTCFEHTPKPL
jgi:hypothetical protein